MEGGCAELVEQDKRKRVRMEEQGREWAWVLGNEKRRWWERVCRKWFVGRLRRAEKAAKKVEGGKQGERRMKWRIWFA